MVMCERAAPLLSKRSVSSLNSAGKTSRARMASGRMPAPSQAAANRGPSGSSSSLVASRGKAAVEAVVPAQLLVDAVWIGCERLDGLRPAIGGAVQGGENGVEPALELPQAVARLVKNFRVGNSEMGVARGVGYGGAEAAVEIEFDTIRRGRRRQLGPVG